MRVAPCGNAYCGTVVKARRRPRPSARKGGTAHIGSARDPDDVRPAGDGIYKGKAFDPKRNMHAPATIRQVGAERDRACSGCAIAGMICKEQRWTRVS